MTPHFFPGNTENVPADDPSFLNQLLLAASSFLFFAAGSTSSMPCTGVNARLDAMPLSLPPPPAVDVPPLSADSRFLWALLSLAGSEKKREGLCGQLVG